MTWERIDVKYFLVIWLRVVKKTITLDFDLRNDKFRLEFFRNIFGIFGIVLRIIHYLINHHFVLHALRGYISYNLLASSAFHHFNNGRIPAILWEDLQNFKSARFWHVRYLISRPEFFYVLLFISSMKKVLLSFNNLSTTP